MQKHPSAFVRYIVIFMRIFIDFEHNNTEGRGPLEIHPRTPPFASCYVYVYFALEWGL